MVKNHSCINKMLGSARSAGDAGIALTELLEIGASSFTDPEDVSKLSPMDRAYKAYYRHLLGPGLVVKIGAHQRCRVYADTETLERGRAAYEKSCRDLDQAQKAADCAYRRRRYANLPQAERAAENSRRSDRRNLLREKRVQKKIRAKKTCRPKWGKVRPVDRLDGEVDYSKAKITIAPTPKARFAVEIQPDGFMAEWSLLRGAA